MTEERFRELALSLPGAVESQHMNHPDFRVNGKIFATLRYPSPDWGMVKLPPERQESFVELDSTVFIPAKGAWGKQGSTSVRLAAAKEDAVLHALTLACESAASKKSSRAPRR